MKNAFEIVKDFEKAVAGYTGAPYCVAVNSCTNALFLCLMYQRKRIEDYRLINPDVTNYCKEIVIPKKTYLSVPMQIKHSGFNVNFREENWGGVYRLQPLPIFDAARQFTSRMYENINHARRNADYGYGRHTEYSYACVSFHWSKILGIQQGGAILHNDLEFDEWARRARFDGRTEGVAPKDDTPILGWHMYLSPEIAAEGLVRLMHLPRDNPDLPNSDYPDLSQMEIFK